MRRIVILALFALAAPVLAQDKVPTLQEERAENQKIQKRIDDVNGTVQEESEAVEKQRKWETRRRENRMTLLGQYESGDNPAPDQVRSQIANLRKDKTRLELQHDRTTGLLSDAEVALLHLDDELDQSTERLEEERAADSDKSAERTAAWKAVEQEREDLYAELQKGLRARSARLQERVESETATMTAIVKALAMHGRENIFLRSPDRLDWVRTRDALSDLRRLPAWSSDAAVAIGGYFSDPEHRPGILRWAAAALFAILVVVFLGRGMRRRSTRLEEATSDETQPRNRSLHALYRFGRRGVHLIVIYLVPWSAAELLPDLASGVQEFLFNLARLATLMYVVWAVYRELLRPGATDRALVQLEPSSRRSIGFAVVFLLVVTAATRVPMLAMQAASYDNPTAFLLLELILLLGATISLSGFVFRRSIFNALLPTGDAGWQRLVRAFGLALRPLLQLLIPLIFVLTALRYEILANGLASFSVALLAVVIGGALVYQLLQSLWLQWIAKRYAGEEDSDPAMTARSAGIFVLRVALFLTGLYFLPVLAGTSSAEFRESLQIGLPFQGKDTQVTVWNLGSALFMATIVWFGTQHAKAILQYQVLARTSIERSTQYTVATLFGYVMLTFGMVIALRQMINLSALGTIVAALSVGIGFGMQDIVSNFISGIILLFERPIRVGDTIEVGANRGLVRTINIRATTVQTRDNIFILVPNRNLISNEVINYGYSDPKMRLSIPVGVSYSSDAEQVRDVLLKVAAECANTLKHPIPLVQFLEFGDSSLNFRLLVWIQRAEQRMRVTSDINFAVFKAFNEANIEIPFPQRDVHIRSAEGLEKRATEPKPEPEPEE